jgi:hypothetical protein
MHTVSVLGQKAISDKQYRIRVQCPLRHTLPTAARLLPLGDIALPSRAGHIMSIIGPLFLSIPVFTSLLVLAPIRYRTAPHSQHLHLFTASPPLAMPVTRPRLCDTNVTM